METYLECMKTKNGLSECMGEAQELGKCMESAKKRASKNRERVSAEELKVQKQCDYARKALQGEKPLIVIPSIQELLLSSFRLLARLSLSS